MKKKVIILYVPFCKSVGYHFFILGRLRSHFGSSDCSAHLLVRLIDIVSWWSSLSVKRCTEGTLRTNLKGKMAAQQRYEEVKGYWKRRKQSMMDYCCSVANFEWNVTRIDECYLESMALGWMHIGKDYSQRNKAKRTIRLRPVENIFLILLLPLGACVTWCRTLVSYGPSWKMTFFNPYFKFG